MWCVYVFDMCDKYVCCMYVILFVFVCVSVFCLSGLCGVCEVGLVCVCYVCVWCELCVIDMCGV